MTNTNAIQSPAAKLFEFVGTNAVQERVYYLKARWNDEREFEDFAEYVDAMKAVFADLNGFEVINVNKRMTITVVSDCGVLLKAVFGANKYRVERG